MADFLVSSLPLEVQHLILGLTDLATRCNLRQCSKASFSVVLNYNGLCEINFAPTRSGDYDPRKAKVAARVLLASTTSTTKLQLHLRGAAERVRDFISECAAGTAAYPNLAAAVTELKLQVRCMLGCVWQPYVRAHAAQQGSGCACYRVTGL